MKAGEKAGRPDAERKVRLCGKAVSGIRVMQRLR